MEPPCSERTGEESYHGGRAEFPEADLRQYVWNCLRQQLRSSAGEAEIVSLERQTQGVSSLTYDVRWVDGSGTAMSGVLKMAPPGIPASKNRDVLRQALIQRILRRAGLAVPAVIFSVAGPSLRHPPMYLMERIDGECSSPFMNGDLAPEPTVLEARIRSAARELSMVHRLNPEFLGIGTGRVVGLEDEVARWELVLRHLNSEIVGEGLALCGRLRASVPQSVAPRITHGDAQLGNFIFRGSEVASIIDWEIWALSDPRIDIAYFATCCDPVHPFTPSILRDSLSVAEITSLFAGSVSFRGRLQWFLAAARLKQYAALALLIDRARQRSERSEALFRKEASLNILVTQAHGQLDQEL